jgi:hypothetical protein
LQGFSPENFHLALQRVGDRIRRTRGAEKQRWQEVERRLVQGQIDASDRTMIERLIQREIDRTR